MYLIGLLPAGKSVCGAELWPFCCKTGGNSQLKEIKEKMVIKKEVVHGKREQKSSSLVQRYTLPTSARRTKDSTYLATRKKSLWIITWSTKLIRILLHAIAAEVGGPIRVWNSALPNCCTSRPGCSFTLARGTTGHPVSLTPSKYKTKELFRRIIWKSPLYWGQAQVICSS